MDGHRDHKELSGYLDLIAGKDIRQMQDYINRYSISVKEITRSPIKIKIIIPVNVLEKKFVIPEDDNITGKNQSLIGVGIKNLYK